MKFAPSHFRLLFVIVLLFGCKSTYATHVVGMDLFYTYVSGNTYNITLVAYGDCAGAAFPSLSTSAPEICIYDGNTSVGSITLAIQAPSAGIEITPVCPADSNKTQCKSTSFAIPGIKKFVYTGTYTLPRTSSVWRFIFMGKMGASSAGRGSTITNVVGPGTSIIQLVDTLDNTLVHNTSPALTVLPTPYFCLNQLDNYNPGASDADGDVLAFSLVTAGDGTANCGIPGSTVTYVSPYTGAAPLATSSFLFDAITGQITFTPNALQRSLVVYNIREFRGGTFIGSCQREMTFLVLTCTSIAPWGGYTSATAGTVVDSTTYNVCADAGAFSITMLPKEADTSNNINVTATGLPAGITFTTVNNNTNHPVCTISGNTAGLTPGTYIYYVTFKDNACPINGLRTVAFTITVLPVPTVKAAPGVTICQGTSTTLSVTGGATYAWSPGTGLSCTLCSAPAASPPATTIYTVTGTAINGCSSKDTVTITVLPQPVLVVGTPAAICIGGNTPLSVSGAISYLWSGAGLSCTTCTNPTATPTVTTVYSVTGTGANGCVTKAAVTITVSPLPVISVAPAVICSGLSATLFPSGGVSYVWSPGTGLSCTSCTNPVVSVTLTTTYTVTGTDINGCKNTAVTTVSVSPTPPPPTVVTPVTHCRYAPTTALTATGASLLWYTGATGGIGSPTAPMPSTTTVGSTKYYVSQTVGGCESARDSITVVIDPLPSITISPSAPAICMGQDTALTASGGISYVWTPSVGLLTTTGATVRANPGGTLTYTVTGTGVNGCSDTASRTVTVHPLPSVTVTPPSSTICIGSSVTLTAAGAISFVWTPAGTLSSSTAAVVTATPTITTTYTVTGTDIFNCATTATTIVTVNPIPPPPAVITPVRYCLNDVATALTATGSSLLWYTARTGTSGSLAAPIPATTTVGSVIWYVSQTIGGCTSPVDSVTVIVNPLPAITATPATSSICEGAAVVLSASGGTTYSWSPTTALSTASGPTTVSAPITTTIYTVTGTDALGCKNTASFTITVHPTPIITIPSASICIGSVATLTASGASTYVWSPATTLSSSTGASVVSTATVTATYTIIGTDIFGCVGAGFTVVTVTPIPVAPKVVTPLFYCQYATAASLTATGDNLLWYTTVAGGTQTSTPPIPPTDAIGNTKWYVRQMVNGCESPRTPIEVTVRANAETDFSYNIKYGCIRDTVQFTNNSKNAYKYTWDFGDETSDTATNPLHYYNAVKKDKDFTIILYASNLYCNGDTTMKIMTLTPANQLVLINVTPDTAITYGTSFILNAEGADTFLWSPEATLNNAMIQNPIATPTDDITYIVTGKDLRGCVDTAQVNVTMLFEDNPVLPSAFTPNGDGDNDLSRILNLKYNKLTGFRIFSRWGQVVFFTTDVNEGWDGTFNGVPQEIGVYVYLFTTTHPNGDSPRSYKGDITLIR